MKTPTFVDLKTVASLLESPADTLILFHRGPDGDAVGSPRACKRAFFPMRSPQTSTLRALSA